VELLRPAVGDQPVRALVISIAMVRLVEKLVQAAMRHPENKIISE